MRKRKGYLLGGVLLCTALLLMATTTTAGPAAKSAAEAAKPMEPATGAQAFSKAQATAAPEYKGEGRPEEVPAYEWPTSLLAVEDVDLMSRAACIGDKDINGVGTTGFTSMLNTGWHDRRATAIYLASEFGCDGGDISGIRYYFSTAPGMMFTNLTIRMRHTTASVYTSPYCMSTTDWTTVYQADTTITGTGWKTFTFSTPFAYTGGNLEVDVCFNNTAYTGGGTIYGFSAGTGVYRTITAYTDSGYGDPLAWTCGTGNPTISGTTTVPRAQFIFPAPSTGACCVDYVCVATNTVSECDALGGTWFGGATCPEFVCPPWNDNCSAVTPVELTPGVPVQFTGSNLGATNDCGLFAGGQVWHAITLPPSSAFYTVTLDYCGTTPAFGNAWINWATGCPCSANTGAGTYEWTTCPDGNITIKWVLAAGTYYYPVLLDAVNGAAGDYVINVVASPTYCASSATSTADETLKRVALGTIDNTTTDCDLYNDFTYLSTDVTRGLAHPFTIVIGDCESASCYTKWLKIWVDWNQDMDFDDPGEVAYTSGAALPNTPCPDYTVNGNITVPYGALLGATRMRVIVRESSEPTPCGTYTWGATEDYTLMILEAPDTGACCVGTGCVPDVTEAECDTLGGVFQGGGSDCDPNPCIGACCNAFSAECLGDMSEADCLAIPDGVWHQYETCATYVCPTPYCAICWTNMTDDWITNVTFAEINNTSGQDGTCSYGDYTDQIAFVAPGNSYTLTVSFSSLTYTECVTAWFDWNRNGQWEATERYDLGCGINATLSTTVTVPLDANEGPAFFRVTEKYSSAATDPCTGGSYGETEDYGLFIGEVEGACCLTDGTCIQALPSECAGTYGGPFTECAVADCNGNTVDDFCDILAGTSLDCNANGIPDECDTAGGVGDCNANGIPDECDIASGTSLDCQPDGIPDECQLVPDCNANGIPDSCETDCNENGVPDDCDIASGFSEDCNSNLIPDECELGGKLRYTYLWDDGTHEDSLGISAGADLVAIHHFNVVAGAEKIESVSIVWGSVAAGVPATIYVWSDPDGDGSPADGIVIASAATVTANVDVDIFNVVPIGPVSIGPAGTSFFVGCMLASSEYPLAIDENGTLADEGWIVGDIAYAIDPNDLDSAAYNVPLAKLSAVGFPANLLIRAEGIAGGADCNENGIPDDCDVPPICDPNDPPPGGCSVDCNGNLIPDECEEDCNGNGRPDDCDLAAGTSLDCNGNAVPDECDIDAGTSLDCNRNDVPDECDIAAGTSEDCQPNGIPDECDVLELSEDCQGDQIPDECQLVDRAIVISESFEGAFPPVGWAQQIQNATYTWGQMSPVTASPDGGMVVDCQYDPALTPQDEWLLTPPLNMNGSVTLTGYTMGSVYWGITPYDNYDVEAWVVIGPTAGDGDDILISQLDTEYWLVNWTWYAFSEVFTAPATTFRVGFRYVGSDGAQTQLDGVVIDGQAGAPSNDCNLNGIPDECDILPEFGGFCDPMTQTCDTDYNGNGVPDSCGCDWADFDGDGDIDLDDFETFRAAFGTCVGNPAYNPLADADESGCVGVTDYQAWIACYRAANPGLIKMPSLGAGGATPIGKTPIQNQPIQGQPVQPSPGPKQPFQK